MKKDAQDVYTIKWTNTKTGKTSYPISPVPLSKDQAEAWARGYGDYTGEIVLWSDYLKENEAKEV